MIVSYELFLAMIGFGALTAAVVPSIARRYRIAVPLSLPIACLCGGVLVGMVLDVPHLDVVDQRHLIQRVTEAAVLLSLTGCGLKLDRRLGLRSWSTTWRLLGITMPLTILLTAIAGWALLGLAPAVALLFAAALAPTDPVLASSVQVGPPGEAEEATARFALTSEAGLNDGLAFPFVHLALGAAAAFATGGTIPGDEGHFSEDVLTGWLVLDVVWRLVAGVAVGLAIGKAVGWAVFRLAPRRSVGDVFLALGLTFFTYGVAEAAHGYGFVAVFIASLSFRRSERGHKLHGELHHFVEQTEALLVIAVVFATGIAISQGLLAPAGWQGVLLAALFLGFIRPLSGWVALSGAGLANDERLAISALGIRGVSTFYYLAYGFAHAPFSIGAERQVWAAGGLIVAASVVLHGLTAPRLMERLQSGGRALGAQIGRRRG